MSEKCCSTCEHHLGSGYCYLNSEKECAENEFELWKNSNQHLYDVENK